MLKSKINPDLSGKHAKLILTFLLLTFLSTNLFAQYAQWVSRYNGTGNGNDGATSIAVDDMGNVYVTGNSAGNGTGTDCVTIKYNSNGDTVWVRRYNGPGNSSDVALSIGVDGLGNVYVAGNSVGSGTGWDYLAIKYNSAGVQQWVSRYNGPANRDDKALSAAIDEMGNVHLTGHSKNSDNWTSIYLTIKYNSAGVLQWARTMNAAPWLFCTARSIALDNSGNVYVTGETGNDDTGAVWSDWLTIKYNSAGGMVWYVIQDGPYSVNSHDKAYSIGVDNSGRVYVSGTCVEYEYPYHSYDVTLAYDGGLGYDWDLLVKSFAADNLGNMYVISSGATAKIRILYPGPIWSKPFGGTCNSIALDSSNNVHVTGSRGGDYGTIKYNSSGVQQWVSRYNGPGNGGDGASSIAVDNLGNVYVTGSSLGSGTGNDYATIKHSPNPLPLNAFNLQSPSAGDTITSLPNSTTPVTFSWDISVWGASYKWVFGTSLPVRLITVPTGADIHSFTITLGELDNILAGLGVTPGNQLVGAWDVWAFRPNPPQNDSLKAANGPRAITLRRGIYLLTAFNLSSPPNGTQINTSPLNDSLIHMKWTHSGGWTRSEELTTYKWKFGSPTIANPLLTFQSNNSGYDSVFSIRNSNLDSVLATHGVLPGEVKVGEWAVWAYTGADSLKSTQTYSLNLRRANLIALFYDPFSTGTDKWTITNDGGDCVWQIFSAPYPTPYTLPPTSVSPVFSADGSYCGVGTSTATTATVVNNINCSGYEYITLEFDNDWIGYFSYDSAIVEASYNGGSTWVPINSWGAPEVRNTHEIKPLPGAANIPNLKVRFRTQHSGYHRWWTIDNVTIKGDLLTGVPIPTVPVLVSPANGAMLVATNPLLDWDNSLYAMSYRIQISTDSLFTNTVYDSIGIPFSEFQIPNNGLNINTTYYWRVNATNLTGTSPWSTIFHFTTGTTSITINSEIPKEFRLYNSYPNPFNPSTKIKFDIPKSSFVKFIVYDVLGREIKTLVNEKLNAGRYEVNWNGMDYPSGVYFYKLETDEYVNVKKMILLK